MKSLLKCVSCGAPIHVFGKTGVYFSTQCHYCGMTSQPMIATHFNKLDEEKGVEVIRPQHRQQPMHN